MTVSLLAMSWQAHDPQRLAGFWAGLLQWDDVVDGGDIVELLPPDDTGFRLRFLASPTPKWGQNRMHYDLTSSSPDDQQATVDRALRLGGRRLDVGQGPDAEHVVLADPEGNELCVIEPGNNFLAECGFIGALACDGSQEVGYFWSRALQWPLVWDQDQETAIRSPAGGPKITWGGPPLMPRRGRDRVHFDLSAAQTQQGEAELGRLVSLGATHVASRAQHEVLLDPDGTEFWLWRRG